jgi:hypothetical protein
MIDSDLESLPPKRARRVLCIGKDSEGRDVLLPTAHGSMLVTGDPAQTAEVTIALLDRLCKSGYQFCALDTRSAYVDFKPAVVFGGCDHAPTVKEVAAALQKPDVQIVVCLEAVGESDRPAFVEKLLGPLRELRATSGRPHWIVVDEAHDLLAASAAGERSPATAAGNALYVSSDPTALAPAILASIDGIVACGPLAPATLDAFAASVEWKKPALPQERVREHQALVWFRRPERPVSLIEIAHVRADSSATAPKSERREKSVEVGQVLRRA